MELNSDFCELIGFIIGDGNIRSHKTPYIVEITGHSKKDFLYYKNFLSNVIKNEIGYIAKIKIRANVIKIFVYNKNFAILLNELGIPSGKRKCKEVRIPDKIIKSSKENLKSCIRGIFDSDGCVYFDKRKIYKSPYIRIELHMANRPLVNQISILLKMLGVKNVVSKNKISICINGKEKVKKYLKIIGFRNMRHKKRISLFYPELLLFNAPIAQLVERLKPIAGVSRK